VFLQFTHASAKSRVLDSRQGAAERSRRLDRPEAEQRNVCKCVARIVRPAICLGGVLDQKKPVTPNHLRERSKVDPTPEQVRDENETRSGADRPLEHVETRRVRSKIEIDRQDA
jgi:hypothetical protein